MRAIELNSVFAGYNNDITLNGIDLVVEAGSWVGLAGPNGAGKSTLLKLLNGSLTPGRGEVRLFQKPIDTYTAAERAKRVAMVPQRFELQHPFSVFDLVAMGRFPHLGRFGRMRSEDERAILNAISLTNLTHKSHCTFQEMSGGEQQRCLIARAIAQQADCLLLDEPTSHLDARSAFETIAALQQLKVDQQEKSTTLIASHDLNLLSVVCDRILLIHDGVIQVDSSPKDALTSENIERTFGFKVQVQHHPGSNKPLIVTWHEQPKAHGQS